MENKEDVKEPTSVTVEKTTIQEPKETGSPEKSARDIFYDSVREFAPDGKYDDDENEYYAKGNEMISALKEKGQKYDDISNKLLKRFMEDPEDAAAFLDYADGMPLVSAIVKNKGRDSLKEPAEGEDGWDDFNKAIEERHARSEKNRADAEAEMEKIRAAQETLKKNAEETQARIDALAEKEGWSPEEKEEFTKYLIGDMENIVNGIYSDDTIGRYRKAYRYDDDIAAAREQGEVEGKNAKIDIERKRAQGSGLPNPNGGGGAEEEIKNEITDPTEAWLKSLRHR